MNSLVQEIANVKSKIEELKVQLQSLEAKLAILEHTQAEQLYSLSEVKCQNPKLLFVSYDHDHASPSREFQVPAHPLASRRTRAALRN